MMTLTNLPSYWMIFISPFITLITFFYIDKIKILGILEMGSFFSAYLVSCKNYTPDGMTNRLMSPMLFGKLLNVKEPDSMFQYTGLDSVVRTVLLKINTMIPVYDLLSTMLIICSAAFIIIVFRAKISFDTQSVSINKQSRTVIDVKAIMVFTYVFAQIAYFCASALFPSAFKIFFPA